MAFQPLFPAAVDAVTQWFDSQEPSKASRLFTKEIGNHCRVWRLAISFPGLDGSFVQLVLLRDFPMSPVRLEVDSRLCLKYPHIESDGHLCHGEEPLPEDFNKPEAAVGRVLKQLDDYLNHCQDYSWCEAEFHKERKDYWSRFAEKSKAPKAYQTKKLLLDVEFAANTSQEVSAISLADGFEALATTSTTEPERLARRHGWPVGTIVRGAALVIPLPTAERWTPSTWPKTYQELDDLVSALTESPQKLVNWYSLRRWPNKAPVFVVLSQGTVAFGWRLIPSHVTLSSRPLLIPILIERVDRQWCLSRDTEITALNGLASKRVTVLGCGSLGSPVIELLARAGVVEIEVVDPEHFEPANTSRHVLGASSIGKSKATQMAARLKKEVPGSRVTPVTQSTTNWLATAANRKFPDLVVDCTGEQSVRVATSRLRNLNLGGAPVLIAWMEPRCAAAHVVLITGDDEWPNSDPVDTAVNVARWPDGLQVQLPACAQGFHPYGMADAWRVAGLAVERALALLNGNQVVSGVWSLVRNKAYFEQTSGIEFNIEPPSDTNIESVTMLRPLPVESM